MALHLGFGCENYAEWLLVLHTMYARGANFKKKSFGWSGPPLLHILYRLPTTPTWFFLSVAHISKARYEAQSLFTWPSPPISKTCSILPAPAKSICLVHLLKFSWVTVYCNVSSQCQIKQGPPTLSSLTALTASDFLRTVWRTWANRQDGTLWRFLPRRKIATASDQMWISFGLVHLRQPYRLLQR